MTSDRNMSIEINSENQPPYIRHEYVNKKKKQIAEISSDWIVKQLLSENVDAAVIARPAINFVRFLDKTNMGHAGILIKCPSSSKWVIYNLISDPSTKHRFYEIKRTTIFDFFIHSLEMI